MPFPQSGVIEITAKNSDLICRIFNEDQFSRHSLHCRKLARNSHEVLHPRHCTPFLLTRLSLHRNPRRTILGGHRRSSRLDRRINSRSLRIPSPTWNRKRMAIPDRRSGQIRYKAPCRRKLSSRSHCRRLCALACPGGSHPGCTKSESRYCSRHRSHLPDRRGHRRCAGGRNNQHATGRIAKHEKD